MREFNSPSPLENCHDIFIPDIDSSTQVLIIISYLCFLLTAEQSEQCEKKSVFMSAMKTISPLN